MGRLTKLSPAHLEQVFRLAASAVEATQIRDYLEAGICDVGGSPLPAVVVTAGAVRWHLYSKRGKAAVAEWRRQLYGDVLELQEAWPAWRLGELGRLYALALEGVDRALTAKDADGVLRVNEARSQSWVKQAGELLERMHKLTEAVRPTGRPEGAKHLHLHGGVPTDQAEYGRLVGELAGRLLELSDAGLLEGRLEPIQAAAARGVVVDVEATPGEPPMRANGPGPPSGVPFSSPKKEEKMENEFGKGEE